MKNLMSIKHLQKHFPTKKDNFFQIGTDYVKANEDISLDILEGETLGIVGESGCGKSTFGRTIIQLHRPTGGTTLYYGETIDDFMPQYVKRVYNDLPKTLTNLENDKNEMEELEAELRSLEGEERRTKNEELRQRKVALENKYGDTLRLVGGLVLHGDLQSVRKTLLQYYEVSSKLAEYKRKLEFEQQKQEMHGEENPQKLEKWTQLIDLQTERKTAVNEQLDELKESLKESEQFKYYEKFLDQGINLSALTKKETRALRKDLQIIFQDPYSSLDPRLNVGELIGEGLLIHNFFKSKEDPKYKEYIIDIMEKCGLKAEFIHRYPHQFSGGQRQRIGIARALALKPKFIVCDEAVSALDVSIQSQIINLLQDLREKYNLTYLFITHDLGVVRYISDRIGVMYFGRLVELGSAKDLFENPIHPYTKQLLNAIPSMEKSEEDRWDVEAQVDGLMFRYANKGEHDSDWVEIEPNHFVSCTFTETHEREEAYADELVRS